MRVALYLRISKGDRKQDTASQLQELREFAARSGWTIVHEYVDRASGKSGDRAQFQVMFADASKRKFDLVFFWALDRFSREGTLATLKYLETLTAAGVNWRSYQEPYFDSCGPFKDVIVSLMATLAKQERIRISERTKAGLQKARRLGKTLGRPNVVFELGLLMGMKARGLSLRAIAAETGISVPTIMKALKAAA
jgi:DNA invertase Pin-like site-specific DNA recombinase